MMVLETYLNSVGRHLPRRMREDVLAELRGELEDRIAGDQARLGRPLTDAELTAVLDRWGPPHRLAARYWSHGPLISAELFPAFRRITATAVALALACNLVVVVSVAIVNGGGWRAISARLPQLPMIGLVVFAIFTLVFGALEFVHPGRRHCSSTRGSAADSHAGSSMSHGGAGRGA
jgi:hypothetical protein